MGAFDLNLPRRLANCKADIGLCDEDSHLVLFRADELFCTKRSNNQSKNNRIDVNYVKTGPASSKSLRVNKLWSLRSKYHMHKL
jgi:hypothetical protein